MPIRIAPSGTGAILFGTFLFSSLPHMVSYIHADTGYVITKLLCVCPSSAYRNMLTAVHL
jgi:hypothetical protein